MRTYNVDDTITGEILHFTKKADAELEVDQRLKVHNSTWYGRRYIHEPENAFAVYEETTKTYVIKRRVSNEG